MLPIKGIQFFLVFCPVSSISWMLLLIALNDFVFSHHTIIWVISTFRWLTAAVRIHLIFSLLVKLVLKEKIYILYLKNFHLNFFFNTSWTSRLEIRCTCIQTAAVTLYQKHKASSQGWDMYNYFSKEMQAFLPIQFLYTVLYCRYTVLGKKKTLKLY